MSFFGGLMGANAGIQGARNMNAAQTSDQNLRDLLEQAQARAQAQKLLQAFAAAMSQQQPNGAAPQQGAPMLPAMVPSPSGVSPPGGPGLAPTGGAPGGVGPISPSLPGGAPPLTAGGSGAAMNPQAMQFLLMQLAGRQSGGSPGANYGAFENVMKTLAPSFNQGNRLLISDQNNAVREDIADKNIAGRTNIAGMNNATREDITNKNIAARAAIAQAQNMIRQQAGRNPIKDPMYRALEQQVNAAKAAYVAKPTDENYAALGAASQKYMQYATKVSGTGAPSSAPTAGGSPPPAAAAGGAVEVIAPDGTPGTIPADQLKDALAAGYKQK